MGLRIHEHDFLPMGASSHFIQCRTCDAAYCILCGKRIVAAVTKRNHGVEKCIESRQAMPGYEEGKGKAAAKQ